jgi:hypothetical protein
MNQSLGSAQDTLIERRVEKYDGQTIWIENEAVYELGNFLGGGKFNFMQYNAKCAILYCYDIYCSGASGVVYEAVNLALKSVDLYIYIYCIVSYL